MSYASAASKNRLPPDQQPHPDQSLLEGDHNQHSDSDMSQSTASDEKIHVVTREEFEDDTHPKSSGGSQPKKLSEDDAPSTAPASRNVPQSQTRSHGHQAAASDKLNSTNIGSLGSNSESLKATEDKYADQTADKVNQTASNVKNQVESDAQQAKKDISKDAEQAKQSAKETKDEAAKKLEQGKDVAGKKYEEAKDEAGKQYDQAKQTAGKYEKVAERKFEAGKEEAKKEYDVMSDKAKNAYNRLSTEAQDDWHKLSKESKKQWESAKNSEVGQELQKPEVWGSMLGVANLAVIGGLAYFTIANWGKPRWDRGVITATVIGASAWFGLQGYILPQTEAVQQRRR